MDERSSNPASVGIARERTIAGFSLTEFRHPPDRRLAWHTHEHASICFVLAGSYTERLRGADRACSPETVVLKPPLERHADHFDGRGGHCLLIEIAPDRLASLAPYTSIGSAPGFVRGARLAALGRRIHREFRGVDTVSPLAAEGLILELLAEAARGAAASAVAGDRAAVPPAWLRRAHELVHDAYREPLTLAAVARAVQVHPAHLARTFRRHYGTSLGDCVRRLRIERAARELATTGTPIAAIALAAGFFDQSHFTRVFRQHLGTTPAEFRAAARTGGTTPLRAS